MEFKDTKQSEDDVEEVQRSCFILCLDTPQGLEFGIDLYQWICGPNFKGVKFVPPGTHFIYYSGGGRDGGGGAPKMGFFVHLKSGDIVVRRWNKSNEDFDKLEESEEENYIAGVKRLEFDAFLGQYPLEENKSWKSLSNHISNSVLFKLEPIEKTISGIFDSANTMEKYSSSKYERIKHKPYYSTISKLTKNKSMTPQQLTAANLDKTSTLIGVINAKYKENSIEILGEIEFAFAAFLLGESLESFEQWKQLIHLVSTSETAIAKFPLLFIEFLDVLQAQLYQVPEDFFVDILSKNNFLVDILKNLVIALEDHKNDAKLREKKEKFTNFIEKRFGKNFLEMLYLEDEEDLPVVVDDYLIIT